MTTGPVAVLEAEGTVVVVGGEVVGGTVVVGDCGIVVAGDEVEEVFGVVVGGAVVDVPAGVVVEVEEPEVGVVAVVAPEPAALELDTPDWKVLRFNDADFEWKDRRPITPARVPEITTGARLMKELSRDAPTSGSKRELQG